MTLKLNKIYKEHCLDGLKKLDDDSIDCCITSPPYWRLRSYGSFPYVWGGNSDCQHDWQSYLRSGMSGGVNSEKVQTKESKNFQIFSTIEQAFCSKCNAWKGDLGLEPTFDLYVEHLCIIFKEVYRVLKPSGSFWLNLSDTYARGDDSLPNKSLCQIPNEISRRLIQDSWILRNEIIWHKPNAMPHPVKDRFTGDYEKIFFFVKKEKYYFKQIKEHLHPIFTNLVRYIQTEKLAIKDKKTLKILNHIETFLNLEEIERNKRSVWSINTEKLSYKHFAAYPQQLVETCIEAGCPEQGIVLDPFMGSGTTARVAKKKNRNYIGFEINPKYIKMSSSRTLVTKELF